MDDLKRYLKEAAKYSFWIISGLVLLLSAVVFYLVKSGLDQAITQRISALNGSFSKISEVSNKTGTHPNESSHKEMEKRLEGLIDDVDQAWKFQYERQKEFLTWPQSAFQFPQTREIFDGFNWLLPSLRAAAFGLILAMLCGPTLVQEWITGELSRVAVLIDSSASMALTESDAQDSASRFDRANRWLTSRSESDLGWLDRQRARFHLKHFSFESS